MRSSADAFTACASVVSLQWHVFFEVVFIRTALRAALEDLQFTLPFFFGAQQLAGVPPLTAVARRGGHRKKRVSEVTETYPFL